jgi:hypothetical protein
MAILNPDHLLDQAARLVAAPAAGRPRQVDIRRAISAAYYSLFHLAVTWVADEFVGKRLRGTARYRLVYRSVDHRTLLGVCEAVQRQSAGRLAPYLPPAGLGADIQAYAAAVTNLQPRRNEADYDPVGQFGTDDAPGAIEIARAGLRRFERADPAARKVFLTLLLCSPR